MLVFADTPNFPTRGKQEPLVYSPRAGRCLTTKASQPYYDLGSHHRIISTDSEEAQVWFDRGLIWAYAFNHHESIQCFRKAILADPSCGMTYWGLAYSVGPHLNKPFASFGKDELATAVQEAHDASIKALDMGAVSSTPVERALIRAMQSRYPSDHTGSQDFAVWSGNYVDAMRSVYKQHAEDLEVATLFADALLNHKLYYNHDLCTTEITSIFEQAFKQPDASRHPGLLHMYIHFVELSETPERGIEAAEHLRDLVPDAGHLQHMPSHIDLLVGDYRRAIISNIDACCTDEKYLAQEGSQNFYSNYRIHNYHALIYAAMFAGNSRLALDTVPRLEASLQECLLRLESMADRLETFMSVRAHVMIRFGRWRDILELSLPEDGKLWCVTTATIHYAKGVAWAATGNIPNAERERDCYREALRRVPSTRMAFPNRCLDVLQIATAMLDGELEYRRGNLEAAFRHLRRAVAFDDALVHNEPWGWMQPTRHALAALLLEAGHVEEALAVYGQDLGFDKDVPRGQRHPHNVWALYGFHECLIRLGRTQEACTIKSRLILAVQDADIPIAASCFCAGAAIATVT